MTRLSFVLPDWTRIAWVSERARATWVPRIQRLTAAWLQLERHAVLAGMRRAALQHVRPEDFPATAAQAAQAGLVVTPVAREGVSDSYSASAKPAADGAWQYRVMVTRPEDAAAAAAAWGNDEALGHVLGYPPCCRAFFRRTWGAGQVDTTWDMAAEGTDGPPEANILLRWLGVRLVPHLPCSFRCPPTVERGRAYAQLGRELGFQEEVDWMLEMLGWPVEWNGLHGIAQVTTPVCRISTRTDATAERLVVQRTGTRYPDEGARGLHFPFKVGGRPPAAKPPRVEPVPAHGMPSWHVNGFSSRTVQEAAHRAILEAVREQPVLGPVLDLGAGDGLLAQRLAGATGAAAALAVEVEPHRAAAAQHRLGRDQVAAGCLSREWPGRAPYGLVALMPGRLLELPTEYAEVVRRRLSAEASLVLLYGYGCWLEPGGLAGLAERAGLGDWVPAGSLARGGPPDLAVAAQLVQPTPVEAKAVLS